MMLFSEEASPEHQQAMPSELQHFRQQWAGACATTLSQNGGWPRMVTPQEA